MTNREFFLKTLKAEAPVFIKVLKAVPKDQAAFKPHERARTAERIAHQLAHQPKFIGGIVHSGVPDFAAYKDTQPLSIEQIVAIAERSYPELERQVAAVSDRDWEEGTAVLTYPGGKWEAKKYDMAWGFLFDAIHHRGQLSTYIRAVGGKVPSIYGGSADEAPPAM
jgi:uncharacterized damage-inducible protein DinB